MTFRKTIAATTAALALSGGLATNASAGTTRWIYMQFNGNQDVQGAMVNNFTKSEGYGANGYDVYVAAHQSNGDIYGNWVGGPNVQCHSYASAYHGAWLYNGPTFPNVLTGWYGTNGTKC